MFTDHKPNFRHPDRLLLTATAMILHKAFEILILSKTARDFYNRRLSSSLPAIQLHQEQVHYGILIFFQDYFLVDFENRIFYLPQMSQRLRDIKTRTQERTDVLFLEKASREGFPSTKHKM